MNQRQSLKAASKYIADLEDSNSRYRADVIAYNNCIDAMIKGESPCPWCEDWTECQLEAKGGKGCAEWMLGMRFGEVRFNAITERDQGDATEAIHEASADRGTGDQNDQGENSAL